jgi:hypothetical protein
VGVITPGPGVTFMGEGASQRDGRRGAYTFEIAGLGALDSPEGQGASKITVQRYYRGPSNSEVVMEDHLLARTAVLSWRFQQAISLSQQLTRQSTHIAFTSPQHGVTEVPVIHVDIQDRAIVVCVFGEVGGVSESSSAAPPRCPCAQWQAGQSIKPKALMHAPGSLEVEPLLVRPKAGRLTLNSVPTALSPRSSSPAKNSKSIRPIFFPVTMLSASRPEIANITVTRIIVMTMRNGPDSGTNVLAAGTQFAAVSSTDSLFGATGASMQSFMVLPNPCVHIRPRCDAGSTLPYSIRLVLLQYRRIDIQLFQKRSIAILPLYCYTPSTAVSARGWYF